MTRKQQARINFDGSDRLFNYCWRRLLQWERDGGVIDGCDDEWLECEASRVVNDELSSFYITGE